MHIPRKVRTERLIYNDQTPMRQMSIVPYKRPRSMGIATGVRTQVARPSAIHHADLSQRRPAHWRKRRYNYVSAIYKEIPQENRYSTQILCLYGIRKPFWPYPLARNILWNRYKLRTPPKERPLYSRGSPDRGHMGPRIDLCQGLQRLDPRIEHHKLCSRLYFEKCLGIERQELAARKGPAEQKALHRQTVREHNLRVSYHKKRRDEMRRTGNSTR